METTGTTAEKACSKCGGTGYIAQFAHVVGGTCFACQGAADTSYTRNIEAMQAAAQARISAGREARRARRAS